MSRKPLVPLTLNELRFLLERDPKLRRDLKRLRLKLTASGRLVGVRKDPCVPANYQPESDPLILTRGALKGRKR